MNDSTESPEPWEKEWQKGVDVADKEKVARYQALADKLGNINSDDITVVFTHLVTNAERKYDPLKIDFKMQADAKRFRANEIFKNLFEGLQHYTPEQIKIISELGTAVCYELEGIRHVESTKGGTQPPLGPHRKRR